MADRNGQAQSKHQRKGSDTSGPSVDTSMGTPDRGSSNSAPPALDLKTDSLFAFTVQYSKIFSDIRANEDYYTFYNEYEDPQRKLPPPLEAFSFPAEEEEYGGRPPVNGHEYNARLYAAQHDPRLMSEHLQQYAQYGGMPRNSPTVRRPPPPARVYVNADGTEILTANGRVVEESPVGSFVGSPSAQTPMKMAQYVWDMDEDAYARGMRMAGPPNAHPDASRTVDRQPSGERHSESAKYPPPRDQIAREQMQQPYAQQAYPTYAEVNNARAAGRSASGGAVDLASVNASGGRVSQNAQEMAVESQQAHSHNGNPLPSPRDIEPASPRRENFVRDLDQQQQMLNGLTNLRIDDQSRSATVAPNMPICRYFATGFCSRGDRCHYLHEIPNGVNVSGLNIADYESDKRMMKQDVRAGGYDQSYPRHDYRHEYRQDPRMDPRMMDQRLKQPYPQQPYPQQPYGMGRPMSKSPQLPYGNGRSMVAMPPQDQRQLHQQLSHFRHQQEHVARSMVPVAPSPTPSSSAAALAAAALLGEVQNFPQNMDQLVGKIYQVCKDQQGCRYLQKKLEEGDPRTAQIIYQEVYPHLVELMTDPFGNYLCQKLIEHANDMQRTGMVSRVSRELVAISKNMHGTRAVQKMIECLSTFQQVQMVKEALKGSVVDLIQDLNGNHVIQRCLNRLTPEDNQFIYDSVTAASNCITVATHRHGCCVLQRCIDHANDAQKVQLMREIIRNSLILVQDAYGNYVVQYVLELPFPELVDGLIRSFLGHIKQLSTQKFSSNVVEKCINIAQAETRTTLIKEILDEQTFVLLLQDPFANYVVQTALIAADDDQHRELVSAIMPYLNQLRNTPFGKRISSKLQKDLLHQNVGNFYPPSHGQHSGGYNGMMHKPRPALQ
eukprot:TRINITY_DN3273_c0_g1_i1.p1 TRINITY_DN3273_c0_g1~~TRINITY_DN3273_c0_g1_i1.p1  ORF type:complete len:891 (+),score=275.36 TRINITY_DN3273_c0_g1_i1:107-2779(+)